jgi:hypothetical protein
MDSSTHKDRFEFKGQTYQLLNDTRDERPNWKEQVLRDFHHCIKKRDWITIKNRITNGLMWGWLKEVKEDEQGFW